MLGPMAYPYVACLGLLSKTVGLLKDCNETQENYRLLGSILCSPLRLVRVADLMVPLLDCDRVANATLSLRSVS